MERALLHTAIVSQGYRHFQNDAKAGREQHHSFLPRSDFLHVPPLAEVNRKPEEGNSGDLVHCDQHPEGQGRQRKYILGEYKLSIILTT